MTIIVSVCVCVAGVVVVMSQAQKMSIAAMSLRPALALAARRKAREERELPGLPAVSSGRCFIWPHDEHHGTTFHSTVMSIAFTIHFSLRSIYVMEH